MSEAQVAECNRPGPHEDHYWGPPGDRKHCGHVQPKYFVALGVCRAERGVETAEGLQVGWIPYEWTREQALDRLELLFEVCDKIYDEQQGEDHD